MADSAALRNRRKRLHAAGNHSICREGRCQSVAMPDGRVAGPGMVEQAVRAFMATMPFEEGDPRGVSSVVAVRLAQIVDQEGSPLAAKECQYIVHNLDAFRELPYGSAIDDIRAHRHAEALDKVMAELQRTLGQPAPGTDRWDDGSNMGGRS